MFSETRIDAQHGRLARSRISKNTNETMSHFPTIKTQIESQPVLRL